MNILELNKAILDALHPRGSRILTFSDLANRVLGVDLDPARQNALRAAVADLERRGEIVRVKGEKLSRIEFTDFQAGALAIRGEGRAFLLSGEPGVSDVPVTALGSALDGDIVLVRVEEPKAAPKAAPRGPRSRFAPRPTGVVVKVLVRRRETVVGKIARSPEGTFVVPFDRKIDARLAVPDGKDLAAPAGIFVEARIIAYPDDRRLALAEVLELIGFEGDPGIDVEVVARKWGIPRKYPETVVAEAEAASGVVGTDERKLRADFTGRTIVTIDGETARDFDDAIEAEELPSGAFRIGIHIADVSHYVPIGSALDAEAFERGTSVYFPDRAIAMLPERLSNDLCSLQPNEERRTVSAVLTLDKHGETVKAEFFRSLIRSRARLTYTAVGDFLEGSPSKQVLSSDVTRMLRIAHRAAGLLRAKRSRRGSLDFDLPDADVILGEEGDVVEIVRAVRNEAHRLIEEFMLAANEAVAKHLEFVPTPALYRVHDRPDESRLVDLRVVLGPLGYDLPEDEEEVTPATFQAILDQAAGKPEERFISDLVLRAQKKAIYSEECRGHYALAAKHYCHFTSPIRRYPDLVVHRTLRESRRGMSNERVEELTEDLPEMGRHTSERERRAAEAERELVQWKKVRFMADKVGDEFEGYVTGVTAFGLFIELVEHFVEGMVHVSTMADDYYRFIERAHVLRGEHTGQVYRLGDKVRVQVIKVDMERRQIDLGLVQILEKVRESEQNRGPRRSKAQPKSERHLKTGRRKPRPGKNERGAKRRTR